MKKHILLLFLLTVSVSLFSQHITNTGTPRVTTKNVITDSLYGSRYGSGVLNDTIKLGSGFLFEDGTYLNSADLEVDTTVIATRAYVNTKVDSDGNITYPDSSGLFVGTTRRATTDSVNLVWKGDGWYLLNRYDAPSSSGAIIITGTSSTATRILQTTASNISTQSPTYQFFRTRGTFSAPSVPTSGTHIGNINFGGYNGSSFVSNAGIITVLADADWSPTGTPSFIRFITVDAENAQYAMYYTRKGSLSIGSTGAGQYDTLYRLNVTGAALTGSQSFGCINVLQTWNTSGNPTGIFANFTNTASGATTKLIDLQTDGTTRFNVLKTGEATFASQVTATAFVASSPGNGFIISSGGRLKAPDGNGIFELTNTTENGFNRLNLGDNTASFPSIKRNAAGIDFVLADNSAPTTISASQAILLDTVSSGNITMGAATYYSFSGTTATWTLPTLASSDGYTYYIKNRGSGNLTINTNAGGNDIYNTAAVNTITVSAGASIQLHNDGTYFVTLP